MSKSVAEYCEQHLKLWNNNLIELSHEGNDVTCHLFEKTIILPKHSSQKENYRPLQIALAVKEKNGGKLNSHLWYLSGFARQVMPEFCVVRLGIISLCVDVSIAALTWAQAGRSAAHLPCAARKRLVRLLPAAAGRRYVSQA